MGERHGLTRLDVGRDGSKGCGEFVEVVDLGDRQDEYVQGLIQSLAADQACRELELPILETQLESGFG